MPMKDSIITCTIDSYSQKGISISTIETSPKKKILEVPGAIEGETVRVNIQKKKRRAFIGTLVEIVHPSENRSIPQCPHFLTCGGCSLQHLAYRQQLVEKQKVIKDFFPLQTDLPIMGSPSLWNYRNKMEFSFSQDKEGNRYLGLMRLFSKGRVENIIDCAIAPHWMSKLLIGTREWWAQTHLEAFRLTGLTGTLMNLTLREAQGGAQKMILLTVSGNPLYALSKDHVKSFQEMIQKVLPESIHPVVSVFILVKQVQKGSPTQIFEMHLSGPTTIIEKLDILDRSFYFHISPQAFFQPNPQQAASIYKQAIMLADLTPEDTVFDLYAGVGSIGITLARHVKRVIGIESNRYSGMDAKENLILNKIDNYDYIVGSVEEKFSELAQSIATNKVVIVDPPRAGLGSYMIQTLLSLKIQKILYISCNPKTQKQDMESLQKEYDITSLQPIDQFPHTPHLENIILLQKRKDLA